MKPRFAHILLMVVSILGCNSGVAQPRPVDMVPTDSAIESPRTKTTSKPAPADLVNPHNEQVDNALVDPSGDALSAFHAALNRAETGQGQARIAFFGASHTAADLWSGHVRRLLQQRFGDAGHGYMMPVRWHGGFRHQDVNMSSSKGWKVHRHKRLDPVPVGDYGFGGVAVSSDDPKQWIEVATCVDNPQGKRADRLEIWYRAGPRGGTIRLRLDNRSIELDTRSKRTQLRFARYDLVDGGHSLRIEPGGDGEVYLYGVVIVAHLVGRHIAARSAATLRKKTIST